MTLKGQQIIHENTLVYKHLSSTKEISASYTFQKPRFQLFERVIVFCKIHIQCQECFSIIQIMFTQMVINHAINFNPCGGPTKGSIS